MKEIKSKYQEGTLTIYLSGYVDSTNAAQLGKILFDKVDETKPEKLVIDASELEYISSAGLRTLLRLRKRFKNFRITGVNTEVWEIFEMTGFIQIMDVEKAYRTVSIDGCEEIGRGANGSIYRIDGDTVVKVYHNPDALDEIKHEREVARLALVLGIPTAISYDVVKVGNSYGSVFELLNATSFSKILASDPEKMDWCVSEYVKLMKKIHNTLVPEGMLPDLRETVISWVEFIQDYIPEEEGKKLMSMTLAIPEDDHMVHGDYHTKNVELAGDEVLLIDMDTMAVGNPIFELASMYNAFIGFGETDHTKVKEYHGFDYEVAGTFWNKVLRAYLNTDDEEFIKEVENKARIIGYTRMIRRQIRRGLHETEEGKRAVEHWRKELIELIDVTDSLCFDLKEITVGADAANLGKVMKFVSDRLEEVGCPLRSKMKIEVSVEEVFVNIASYAYEGESGDVSLRLEVEGNPPTAVLTFKDCGKPYNPLAKEDPDVDLPADEREIGGLGIFLIKKSMDQIHYEYAEGQNILEMRKEI
ncbi:MAG: anti-sigma factor antagonist [Eubacterium sp.]|nr:anti-sigma factor antagonist [Eubacterium sp.]